MGQPDVKVIGVVRSTRDQTEYGGWLTQASEIHLSPEYAGGLDGIEGYSHVIVITWLDRVERWTATIRPQGNPEVPEVGIFACRCPGRPTPLGITTCTLRGRDGNVLRVEGLDAVDGTPVLDVKPYWPQYDGVEAPRYPAWVDKLKF